MFLQALSKTKTSIFISPDTVRYYASFIDSSATITDTTIQFGRGTHHEQLLRVPLIAPGEFTQQTMIRITIGMNPSSGDSDPLIGITDGTNRNQFWLVEDGTPSNSNNLNPCEIINGVHNGRSAPHGNPVAGVYVLLFDPLHRFGSCSTNTGFATSGKFNSQLDPDKGLNIVLHRNDAIEQYTFHYFLVEFLPV